MTDLVDNIEYFYTKDNLSCRDISQKIRRSPSFVYQHLKKRGLMRNHSESILCRNTNCDYTKTFINDHLLELIDGFMLGDGHIQKGMKSSRLSACLKELDFCDYWLRAFKCYDPKATLQTINSSRYQSTVKFWNIRTKSHGDISQQRQRWYHGNTKIVPLDVRITPLSVSLWFCGDGTRARTRNTVWALFCTQGFRKSDVKMLSKRLQQTGIDCHVTNQNKIYVSANGYKDLIKYAPCSIDCYSYKFKE